MPIAGPSFWRVHCHIGQHPGQWQYWFREQCCAVGWHPPRWENQTGSGWELEGHAIGDLAWSAARNALNKMRSNDWIVATLPGWRIGRIGRIVRLEVKDEEWNPIVKPRQTIPFGENGRRILVRWDLNLGPDDPSKVVLLPAEARWNPGQARATIRELPVHFLPAIKKAMSDDANWVSLAGAFSMEKALSDYISIHPGRLESGMIAHPSIDARELTFQNRTRADVVLQDRKGRLVVAECKQNAPTIQDLKQVSRYRDLLRKEFSEFGPARALLIHGGATRVLPEVAKEAKKLDIEMVYFELQVNFSGTRR